MNNIKKVSIAVILICSLLLQGCRPSTAIRTPNKDNSGKKTNTEQLASNPNAKEESKDISANKAGDSDKKNDDKKKTASSNTNTKSSNGVKTVNTYSKDGEDASASGAGIDTQTNDNESGTGGNEGGASTGGTGGSGGSGDQNTIPPENASDETRQVYDANGELRTVPKNVDRVSAVGEASSVVEMLGGTGRLVATSADYKSSTITANIFSDINSIPALWTGSGTDGISDANFQTLLSQKPQVCFYISGTNTFNDAQLNALNAAKITLVVLPKPSITSRLKDLVSIVGNTLGDMSGKGGTNAPDIANQYKSYLTNSINEMSGKVKLATLSHFNFDTDINKGAIPPFAEFPTSMWGNCTDIFDIVHDLNASKNTNRNTYTGKITALVTDWDDNAAYKWYTNDSGYSSYIEGTGAPVVRFGLDSSPLTYYMSIAGIVNGGIFGNEYATKYSYFVPNTNSLLKINGKYGSELSNALENMECMFSYLGKYTYRDFDKDYPLTNENCYTGLLVINRRIKNQIESSTAKDKSLWKNYNDGYDSEGKPLNYYGYVDDYGFVYEGHHYDNKICGPYDIFVNPKGVASWIDGTPESVLESLWLASKFYPSAVSETEVKNKVREFYKTFYRHNLTDGELALILAGPES